VAVTKLQNGFISHGFISHIKPVIDWLIVFNNVL